MDQSLVALPAVEHAPFPAGEIEGTVAAGLVVAAKRRQHAHGVEAFSGIASGDFQEGGHDVEGEAHACTAAARFHHSRPADEEGHAETAVVVILLSASPGIVVLGMRERATVVGREDNDRVLGEACPLKGIEHAANTVIEVLDESNVHGPLLIEIWLPLLDAIEPLLWGFDRKMRRVVGQVEEKWLLGLL